MAFSVLSACARFSLGSCSIFRSIEPYKKWDDFYNPIVTPVSSSPGSRVFVRRLERRVIATVDEDAERHRGYSRKRNCLTEGGKLTKRQLKDVRSSAQCSHMCVREHYEYTHTHTHTPSTASTFSSCFRFSTGVGRLPSRAAPHKEERIRTSSAR